eukprot:gene9121-12302_t
MNEVALITSFNDSGGVCVIELSTGISCYPSFKNCIADSGTLCTLGTSNSSFSGYRSSGDYFAVAQAKKPCINIYQWGNRKSSLHMQCHIQQIVTCLCSDSSGTFLFGGTKNGWIYIWDCSTGALINSWQSHFKAVTRVKASNNGQFLVSFSEDGMGRVWDLSKVLDNSDFFKSSTKTSSISAYRSWNPHTLTVKDMYLIDGVSLLRAISCSYDKTVVMYDIYTGKQCLRLSFPQPLESIVCNPTEDMLCVGSVNGSIYIVDLSITAISITASSSKIVLSSGSSILNHVQDRSLLPPGTIELSGHSKCVTSLSFSSDNVTLVSGSEDGTVKMWNIWTRQCLKECRPMNKFGITNIMIIRRPESILAGVNKPSLFPMQHLKKYSSSTSTNNATVSKAENDNNDENKSNLIVSDNPFILGPCMLGMTNDYFHSLDQVTSGNLSNNAKMVSTKAANVSSTLDADFIPLESVVDNITSSTSKNTIIGESSSVSIKVDNYEKMYEEILIENQRLKSLCSQLKSNLEHIFVNPLAENNEKCLSGINNQDEYNEENEDDSDANNDKQNFDEQSTKETSPEIVNANKKRKRIKNKKNKKPDLVPKIIRKNLFI